MFRKVLKSKIHRATVTHADLDYEGSITLSPELIEAGGLREFEAVCIWNITSGTRFETYIIQGVEGSKDICINGAAAHLVNPKDLVIISSFDYYKDEELISHQPKVVFVDENNNIVEQRKEVAGPLLVNS